jgi:hypothetical protein
MGVEGYRGAGIGEKAWGGLCPIQKESTDVHSGFASKVEKQKAVIILTIRIILFLQRPKGL